MNVCALFGLSLGVIEVAVETGLRQDELLGLRWDQIDLERREVRLTVTKSSRPRVVPLSAGSVAIFVATAPIGNSPFVFNNPRTGQRYRNLWQSFQKACNRAGISDFRWHDLRHTFASWHVQSGVDLYRLSRILGHSTLQMTTRYAHLATEQLHEAVSGVATFMATTSSDYSQDRKSNDDTSAR